LTCGLRSRFPYPSRHAIWFESFWSMLIVLSAMTSRSIGFNLSMTAVESTPVAADSETTSATRSSAFRRNFLRWTILAAHTRSPELRPSAKTAARTLTARGESRAGRVRSAAGADGEERRRERCDSSVRSRNEASGPAPPEPEGQPGVAAHGFVVPPSQCPALPQSSLLALGSQALVARTRGTFTTGC
jgi:hypothetical protein